MTSMMHCRILTSLTSAALLLPSICFANFTDPFSDGVIDVANFNAMDSAEVSISESSGALRFNGTFPTGMSSTSAASVQFLQQASSGSADSWTIEMTAGIDTSVNLGLNEVVGISMIAENAANGSDFAEIGLFRGNLGDGTDTLIRFAASDDGAESIEEFNVASVTGSPVYLSLSYDGATDLLTAAWGNAAHNEEIFSTSFASFANWTNYSSTVFRVDMLGIPLESGDLSFDSDINISGNDFYIDDFQITGDLSLVPEPSTYAFLAGAIALSLVMLRRKRR